MRTTRTNEILALGLIALSLTGSANGQNLVWENQGLTNAHGIASGSQFSYNGATVTLNWSATTNRRDTIVPAYGSNYVSYQSGMEGGHVGHVLIGFDVSDDDYRNFVTLTLNFSTPQTNLAFSLLDIDTGSWDDGVEVTFNGSTNVRSVSGIWSYGQSSSSLRTVVTDDEDYMYGWEGDRSNAATNQNYGNLNLDFTGRSITSVTIKYFCTDEGDDDPGSQKIGISDLYVTPEPSATVAALLLAALLALRRRMVKK